jgi:integral membrane protein
MLKLFKIIALLEGISLLLLLFFAVPMKHLMHEPIYVRVIGMAHGLLFIAYVYLAFMVKGERKWSSKQFALVLLASILPFGTFYMEMKYLKN